MKLAPGQRFKSAETGREAVVKAVGEERTLVEVEGGVLSVANDQLLDEWRRGEIGLGEWR